MRPIPRLTNDIVAECLDLAVLAPSVHNSQPWRFRVRGRDLEVLADRDRQLTTVDPSGRQMMISVGAAIFNLRVGLLAHGRLPVLNLLPEDAHGTVAARITAGPSTVASGTVQALANAIPRRHTNRLPFHSTAIPWGVLDGLITAAAAERATLNAVGPVVRDAILRLTRTADERLRTRSAYRAEIAAWTYRDTQRSDGVPAQAFGPRDLGRRLVQRDFALARPTFDPGAASFEVNPRLLVVTTTEDSPRAWLQAGQALQRILLTATVRGLVATPMNQALEVPRMRRLVTNQTAGRFAQMILRIGYAVPTGPTPRRPWRELLVSDADHL
jgi:nitroreductase